MPVEDSENKKIEEKLSNSIALAKRVFFAFDEVKSFLRQRFEVEKQIDQLSFLLKTLLRFISTTEGRKPLYLRPVDLILDDVQGVLNHALHVACKFNRKSIIGLFFDTTKIDDFQPVFRSIDDCIANMRWLITLYDPINNGACDGIVVFAPPFFNNNPMLLVVWHCIAIVQMGQRLSDRIDAIKSLTSLAQYNELSYKYVVQEEGVPPLLKLLEDGDCLYEQIEAANALCTLTNDREIMENIVIVLVRLLKDAPMDVQIQAAELVTKMAELYMTVSTNNDSVEWNVIWPLVTLLSSEKSINDSKINLQKHELKIRCAEALWTLAARDASNCWTITRTKAMRCLAELVEKERGKLQYFCLMTIMEIATAAESDIHFRCTVFKTNSPSARAVVDQLLRVIKESEDPIQQIPAIKSIGSLAKIFTSHETRVISLLVSLLNNKHLTVASEAAVALKKFTSPENYLCFEHWKSVMKFISFPALMRFIGCGNKMQRHKWDVLIICCLYYIYADLRGSHLDHIPANNWEDKDYEFLFSSLFPHGSYEFSVF